MARSRSIPTQLFWNPAFSLLDSDTQIILLGLTLIADDEGRGVAQTRFLVRQFDKDAAVVEQALTTLREMLEEHQCAIEEDAGMFTIAYPQGTTRQELYPRTFNARFRVLLPDSFEIREVNAHDGSFSVYAVIG